MFPRARRRTLRVIGPFLVLASLLLAIAPIALASAPITYEAIWQSGAPVGTGMRQAGPNLIFTEQVDLDLTGDLVGVMSLENRVVLTETGEFHLQSWGTFTGTVDGKAGTFRSRGSFSGSVLTGEISGHATIISGAGELANLRGQGTVSGNIFASPPGGTQTWQLHWDP